MKPWERDYSQQPEKTTNGKPWEQGWEYKPEPEAPLVDSALAGAGQGLTFGFGDEMAAGAGAVYDYLAGKFGADTLTGDGSIGDRYEQRLDWARRSDDLKQKANPKTFAAGEIGGGIATALAPGGAALQGASRSAQAAGAVGAGALYGLGKSKADKFSTEALGDAAIGGAMSGVGFGLATGLGAGMKSLGKGMRSSAEKSATKAAIGNQAKYYDKLTRKKMINERGRHLLDEGIVGFGDKADDIAGKTELRLGKVGEEVGEYIDEATNAGVAADGNQIAKALEDVVAENKWGRTEATKGVANRLLREAENYRSMGEVSPRELQVFKSELADAFGPLDPKLSHKASRKVYGILNQYLDDSIEGSLAQNADEAVEVVGEFAGRGTGTGTNIPSQSGYATKVAEAAPEGTLADYKSKQSLYSHLADTKEAAEKLASRQDKNRLFSLSDYIAGGVGYAGGGGNPITAAMLAGANKVMRERGRSSYAVSADKLGKILQESPDFLGPYYAPLKQAYTRSPQAGAAAHYVLFKQNPDYRSIWDQGSDE